MTALKLMLKLAVLPLYLIVSLLIRCFLFHRKTEI